jgi:hypothetical protein
MKLTRKLMLTCALTLASTAAYAAEDCIPFNPATATVQFLSGDWKIVDGSHWMFSFGDKGAEAKRALQIIKTYGMAKSCFVGRPDPSFWYLLKATGQPPRGNLLAGEDCISFNPSSVTVKLIPQSNTWKMVQGNMWMEDFGNNKQEAYDALEIVKKYRFNQQCFVGRPGASFRYWKSSPSLTAEVSEFASEE